MNLDNMNLFTDVPRTTRSSSSKNVKLERACDVCRRRKTRCDAPSSTTTGRSDTQCSNCRAADVPCTFLEGSKPRAPPRAYVAGLEDRLRRAERLIRRLSPDVDYSAELGPEVVYDSWRGAPTSSRSYNAHREWESSSPEPSPSVPSQNRSWEPASHTPPPQISTPSTPSQSTTPEYELVPSHPSASSHSHSSLNAPHISNGTGGHWYSQPLTPPTSSAPPHPMTLHPNQNYQGQSVYLNDYKPRSSDMYNESWISPSYPQHYASQSHYEQQQPNPHSSASGSYHYHHQA